MMMQTSQLLLLEVLDTCLDVLPREADGCALRAGSGETIVFKALPEGTWK